MRLVLGSCDVRVRGDLAGSERLKKSEAGDVGTGFAGSHGFKPHMGCSEDPQACGEAPA